MSMPCLCVPAAALGWWAQAGAVRLGFRRSGRPDAGLDADFRERPPRRPWSTRQKVVVGMAVVAAFPLGGLVLFMAILYPNR